jgi:hypothetical protein
MQTEDKAGFKGWAIVEVFGHRKLGGLVEVNPPELPGLVRVDVLTDGDQPVATQYYGPSAIFCLTPTTESLARRLAKSCEVRPVGVWELPALDPPPTSPPPRYRPDRDEFEDSRYYRPDDDDPEGEGEVP